MVSIAKCCHQSSGSIQRTVHFKNGNQFDFVLLPNSFRLATFEGCAAHTFSVEVGFFGSAVSLCYWPTKSQLNGKAFHPFWQLNHLNTNRRRIHAKTNYCNYGYMVCGKRMFQVKKKMYEENLPFWCVCVCLQARARQHHIASLNLLLHLFDTRFLLIFLCLSTVRLNWTCRSIATNYRQLYKQQRCAIPLHEIGLLNIFAHSWNFFVTFTCFYLAYKFVTLECVLPIQIGNKEKNKNVWQKKTTHTKLSHLASRVHLNDA